MNGSFARYLTVLMALLAAMTLSLPVRARISGALPITPASGPFTPGQPGVTQGGIPAPAQAPLCHLRCRGFIASVPDAPPQQQQAGVQAALAVCATIVPQSTTEVALHSISNSPPGSSPPRFTVLRL